MRDRPTGDELLACASKLLRENILPTVPAEQRHSLLMILNAMSIAERQCRFGDAPGTEELAALEQLLGERCDGLADANRRFAERLRAGWGDPGSPLRDAAFAQLRTIGRQRLRESNPRLLEA